MEVFQVLELDGPSRQLGDSSQHAISCSIEAEGEEGCEPCGGLYEGYVKPCQL